ncbi:MAG: hypothetical protein LBE12_20685 [Planctomycetaceae bacterium]|nr:hypothetical protein [Planctomycetaceae bacterium]
MSTDSLGHIELLYLVEQVRFSCDILFYDEVQIKKVDHEKRSPSYNQ